MQIFSIDESSKVRLDKYIRRAFGQIPQSALEKFIRNKLILINTKKCKSSSKVQSGDKIAISINIIGAFNVIEKASDYIPDDKLLEIIKSSIIYEDKNILAINKPAGLPCQGGANIRHSLDKIVYFLKPGAKIVHRIDKETSGIVLFAKNLEYSRLLTGFFKTQNVHKTYYAIASGAILERDETYVEKPLLRMRLGNEEKMVTSESGLSAATKITIIKKLEDGKYLLKINPFSGRKHQIRAHLSYLGLGIIGDEKYGEIKNSKMLLHAGKIKIEKISFSVEAKLPDYFDTV